MIKGWKVWKYGKGLKKPPEKKSPNPNPTKTKQDENKADCQEKNIQP